MSDDESKFEGDESTKQVDREALSRALNQSVDSKEVLERVNAEIEGDAHAEGTAKVDREHVAKYLEAARSGEFPAAEVDEDEAAGEAEPTATGTADAETAAADPAQATAIPPVPVPSDRTPVPADEAEPSHSAAGGDAVAESAESVQEIPVDQISERISPSEEGPEPTLTDERSRQSMEEFASWQQSSPSWVWILLLAISGALIGVGLAVGWLVFGPSL